MELLGNLSIGLETAFTLNNLFFCLIGVFLGTAIGVLPGLGPTATIAMLLPITFGLPPVSPSLFCPLGLAVLFSTSFASTACCLVAILVDFKQAHVN